MRASLWDSGVLQGLSDSFELAIVGGDPSLDELAVYRGTLSAPRLEHVLPSLT